MTNIHINITKKSLFYKNLSFIFNAKLKSKNYLFNSSSATIINNPHVDNRYILNVRIVNYSLNKNGSNSHNYDKTITLNKIIVLDNFFNPVAEKNLKTEFNNESYNGVEDVRLFSFNNKIYYIGSAFNINTNNIEIVSDIFDFYNDYQYNLNFIKPTFQTSNSCEKNWVFLKNNNNELNVVYKWNPIYICKIDYETKTLNLVKENNNIPGFFNKIRGSTNGVEYDNKIWFIVHFQKNVNNNSKNAYLHNLVVFDKDMNLLGYSKSFNFENNLVEYCIGMEVNSKNNFVITYSTLDKTTKLAVFSSFFIYSLIIPYN